MKKFDLNNMQFNMNNAFAGFAALGLVISVLIKFIFSESDNSFYPTLIAFVVLLIVFHRLSYIAITENKFKEIGDGKRLTDGSIVDGVYYLGFTYTLLILVTSFVSMGQDPGTMRLKYDSNLMGLMDILNRFCVGLFTTGYGLVARIQLSNLVEIEELDPEGLKEKLNTKTAALIAIIELGTTSLQNLVISSNESISNSVVEATNSISGQSDLISSNLSEISGNLTKVLAKLKKQVENLDLTDATTAVEMHLSSTSGEVLQLNQAINEVSQKFSGAGTIVGESSSKLIHVLDQINAQQSALLGGINSLAASFESMVKVVPESEQVIKSSTVSLNGFDTNLQASLVNLAQLTQALLNSQNSLNSLVLGANQASSQLQQSSGVLGTTMANSANSIQESVKLFSERLDSLDNSILTLERKINSRG